MDAIVQDEARRLKALFKAKQPFLKERGLGTQAAFGERYGIGNQGAVWQFLNGRTPLSMKAAKGLARGLGCSIDAFSPRLAAEAGQAAGLTAQGQGPAGRGSTPRSVEPPTSKSPTTATKSLIGSIGISLMEIEAGDAPGASMTGVTLNEAWLKRMVRYEQAEDLALLTAPGGGMMEPTIEAGDVLLIDRSVTEMAGSGIYAMQLHKYLTVARLHPGVDGQTMVIYDNKAYPAMPLPMNPDAGTKVLGRVVMAWNARRV